MSIGLAADEMLEAPYKALKPLHSGSHLVAAGPKVSVPLRFPVLSLTASFRYVGATFFHCVRQGVEEVLGASHGGSCHQGAELLGRDPADGAG